eukprot:121679-Amphidinium_carterae.1
MAWRWQRVWNQSQVSAMRIPLPLKMVLTMAAKMRRRDLILPDDLHGTPWTGVVAITQSKRSTRFPRMQSVVIEDELLLQVLTMTFGHDPPTRFLVHGGLRELLKVFLTVKACLGLAAAPYVLAGLRGGGACEYLRNMSNLSYLQYRGRWTNAKSMWHYLQSGVAATTYRAVRMEVQKRVRALVACASDVFTSHTCAVSAQTRQ